MDKKVLAALGLLLASMGTKSTESMEQTTARIARAAGVPPAMLLAIAFAESGGNGYYADGQMKRRFEGHVFKRTLPKYGFSPQQIAQLQASNPDLLYDNWREHPGTSGAAEIARYNRAAAINLPAAIEATGWGFFGMQGFLYQMLGLASPQAFLAQISKGYEAQLKLYLEFLRKRGIVPFMKTNPPNFLEITRRQTGSPLPVYAQRLEQKYNEWKSKGY